MRRRSAESRSFTPAALLVLGAAMLLNGCADPGAQTPGMEAAVPGATRPPTIRPDQLVGRWGVAAYHQESARARTEAAARQGCRQPYVINPGRTGGVIMHMADDPEPQELVLKGGTTGKNYVGPPGELTTNDREVVLIGTDMMTLKYLDPEIVSRYGTMVYVRCPDRPEPAKAKTKAKPKPKPAT